MDETLLFEKAYKARHRKGMLITCVCCGTTTFLEAIGDGERYGGFVKWNKFEPLPETWEHSSELGGELCTKCRAKWDRTKEDFLSNPLNHTIPEPEPVEFGADGNVK